MTYRILHTADWHLGQKFYNYDREAEHSAFLDWLINELKSKQIDLLMLSGDIFDVANPSASAQRQYYDFIRQANLVCPQLQLIVVAGNHDSGSRLEAPSALLNIFNTTVIGAVSHFSDNNVDYNSVLVPLQKNGRHFGTCLAVPFLRMGDYQEKREEENSYSQAIARFYDGALDYAKSLNPDDAFITMGHLHTAKAEISDSERGVKGGLDAVSADAFSSDILYTGLGHIHKAQKVGGLERICYSGSPLPLSFSEMNYSHSVSVVDIDDERNVTVSKIQIPRTVDLMRIGTPDKPLLKSEILERIAAIAEVKSSDDMQQSPYLEVNILKEDADASAKTDIIKELENRYVRLCRIQAHYKQVENQKSLVINNTDQLKDISPWELFSNFYSNKYSKDVPSELKSRFEEVLVEINK